jgi:hypothetical protein
VATLDLDGRLANGLYRLLVCGSTTLRDATGNPLDGDGDGTGGDDLSLTFRADLRNRFVNGHFDCDASGWAEESSGGAEQAFDPLTDADDSPESGAAMASVPAPNPAPGLAALGQCVPLGAGEVALTGRARLDLAEPTLTLLGLQLECEFFAGASCSDAPLGAGSVVLGMVDTEGLFVDIAGVLAVPAGTASALCTVTWLSPSGRVLEAWLDGLTALSTIFADGFESGDTSAWSVSVP